MDFSTYTTKGAGEVAEELKTSDRGLSPKEITSRQRQYGPNEVGGEEVAWWHILWRQFKSPFIYLLMAAALLSFFLQELINGLMIVLFVAINAALGFIQEYHSERTVKLLKKYVAPKVRAKRDGQEVIVASRELVPGDLVIVGAGDIIPADLRFIKENDLLVDESILTGESVPVKKISEAMERAAAEFYQAENVGFSGTTVASGRGEGIVIAVGRQTAIGDVSRLTTEMVRESSFEKGIKRISKFILRLILVTLIFVFLANLFIKGERADFIELLVFSIALAVSVIPEALPVVTTFSLSRGAKALARHKVVVKRLSAIEDLGGIEVLCSDKTGTLTENTLTVADTYVPASPTDQQAAARQQLIFHACLASSIFTEKLLETSPNNAFDLALWNQLSKVEKKELDTYNLISEIPFDPERRRNSVVVKKKNQCELIIRGAPEALLPFSQNVTAQEIKTLEQWMADEGRKGRRVLAMATKACEVKNQYDVTEEEAGLRFLGIISFVDPIKETTKRTIKKAEKLGVAIKILTGDSREVAGAVAYQVGLVKNASEVMTGEELNALPPPAQKEAAQKRAVFARVSPEQKYKIIQLLQENNEVGFLGEGINDAPALKIANVGLVVDGAADIAREAADIILLQKSLEVVVDAIREGRGVFANTLKYIKVTLASNFGNFFAVAIASLLIDFLPMLPLQILLLNLLSDFPMIAIATDNVDSAELRKPRSYQVREIALLAIVLGVVSTVFDFIFFAAFYRIGPQVLQTNWFIGSILTELVLLFSIRTAFFFPRAKRPSATLLWLTIIAAVTTIVLPFTTFGQEVFSFTRPQTGQLFLIIGVVVCYLVATETVKLLYHRFFGQKALEVQ